MTAPTLEQLISAWSPRLRQAFTQGVYSLRDAAQIAVIVKMLEAGDVDGALRAVGLDPLAFKGFDQAITSAFDSGGSATVAGLPSLVESSGLSLKIGFDARNPRAEQWLKDHSSTMITSIMDDQRNAVRQFLQASLQTGANPKDAAIDLVGRVSADTGKREGGVIGLTATQEAWARNYAQELAQGDAGALTRTLRDKRFDASVKTAIASGKPIPADLQAKMVQAYRNRALRYRGQTIGRTEAMTALHQSQQEAMQQAFDKGQVQQQHVRKIWHSAEDDRVRETHRVLDGESTSFEGVFTSPSGATLRFPGDPLAPGAETINCRCTLSMRVDRLANIK